MSDFFDMLIASDIASARTRQEIRSESAHQRAKNIEDNFGIKPAELEEYRSKNGGTGILKFLAFTAAGLAVGALLIGTFGSGALLVGAIAGMLGGALSMSAQEQKVQRGYSDYLDGLSAQGRETRERGKGVEYDNGTGRRTAFATDLAASRQQPADISR